MTDLVERLRELARHSDEQALWGLDLEHAAAEIERLRGIIFAHNTALQARCGIGEQEAVACGYRPYFERSGRRCTHCPVYEMIEVGE